jgi:hypothetical protein
MAGKILDRHFLTMQFPEDGRTIIPKVLIAAAGGRVARRVVAVLCARNEPPRALVRNAKSPKPADYP